MLPQVAPKARLQQKPAEDMGTMVQGERVLKIALPEFYLIAASFVEKGDSWAGGRPRVPRCRFQ